MGSSWQATIVTRQPPRSTAPGPAPGDLAEGSAPCCS